jgi:hypothetical protein
MSYFINDLWAVSSAVEHCFHTAGVTGSIPVPPTIKINKLAKITPISVCPYGLRYGFSAANNPTKHRVKAYGMIAADEYQSKHWRPTESHFDLAASAQ